jgi:hypothetical protein
LLQLDDAVVDGGPLSLKGATIEGDLTMNRCIFEGGLEGDRLRVGGSLLMNESFVQGRALRLVGATIAGNVHVTDSYFAVGESVTADGLHVGGNLIMNDNVFLGGGAAVLRNHKRRISLIRATIAGDFQMEYTMVAAIDDLPWWGLQVGGTLSLIGSIFATARPSITEAYVGGSLLLSRAMLPAGLDLTNTKIGDELRLTWPGPFWAPPLWGKDAQQFIRPFWQDVPLRVTLEEGPEPSKPPDGTHGRWLCYCGERQAPVQPQLLLRGTHVGSFQDEIRQPPPELPDRGIWLWSWPATANRASGPWPSSLDVQSFVYDRLGAGMLSRDASLYSAWLARDPNFTRQPYQQLAAVLRAGGYPDQSDTVLRVARNRELTVQWCKGNFVSTIKSVWLALLFVSISYGLTARFPCLILFWILVFTAVGACVVGRTPDGQNKGWGWCCLVSFARLLPLIGLDKEIGADFKPQRQSLTTFPRVCLLILVIVGYLLGSFVLAAVAGLTQARN